ncbi:MAG: hypothetical protein R6U98_36660 [Pirellulaceae bacterium]
MFGIEANPDGDVLPSAPLICHDTEEYTPDGWWIGNKATSVMWIETENHHGFLFFVYEGVRDPWSLTPVEQTALITRAPGSAEEVEHGHFTGTAKSQLKVSVREGRMIVLQPDACEANPWESIPKGCVFHLP